MHQMRTLRVSTNYPFLQIHRAGVGIGYATDEELIDMEKTGLVAWASKNANTPSEIESGLGIVDMRGKAIQP
jgi:hypothetical protein